MREKRTVRSIKLIAAASVITIAACAAASADELRFTVWTGNDAHLAMLNGIAESFEAEHPGVDVVFETIPAGDYVQKLTFQLAGGNPPDLGWMFEDAAPAFADAGVLEDVGPHLRAAEGYDLDDFSAPAMTLWANGDSVHGVPFSTSPFMVYYNKTMFDEAGLDDPLTQANAGTWDMDAFRATAKALADKGEAWAFDFKDGQGYDTRIMHALMPPIRAHGGYAWKDGECGFDNPEAVAAVKQLHEMVFADRSIVPPGEQGDFFSGDAAMTINQISRASRLTDAPFEWGIAPLPTGPGGEAPVIGQAGIVVFSESDQKDLAKAFLAHITNAENVAVMAQFFPPARKSVLESGVLVEANERIAADQMKNVAKAIEAGSVLPSHENAPQIAAAMKPRVDALWKADADVEAALKAVCAAIEPHL
ncbi:MAG: sugar ABC transporter substrate-binding protein [Devosia sp.]